MEANSKEQSGGNGSSPPPARKKLDVAGVLHRHGDHVSLTHLDLAGYLMLHDIGLSTAKKTTRTKFEFTFLDPDKRCEQLAIDFVNSQCARYADAIARLKSVIHRFHGRDFESPRGKSGNRVFGERKLPSTIAREDSSRDRPRDPPK